MEEKNGKASTEIRSFKLMIVVNRKKHLKQMNNIVKIKGNMFMEK
jgi:hypothetical protein